jgi:hypothetical protein
MPRRDTFAREWAALGNAIESGLPVALSGRLLTVLAILPRAAHGDAVEAIAALEEIARDGRAYISAPELLALIERLTTEARHAYSTVTASRRTLPPRMRKPRA